MTQKGYSVFSPICHSHNIEEYRQNGDFLKCKREELNLDCIHKQDNINCQKCDQLKYPTIDWVQQDLQYIMNWMRDDGGKCVKNYRHCEYIDPMRNCEICDLYFKYDSGVIGVVCPSAFDTILFIQCYLKDKPNTTLDNIKDIEKIILKLQLPFSIGVITEYLFMKAHHILIITLETALTQPQDKWGNFAL